MFRHIVLFRVHDEASDAAVESAVATLRALGDAVEAHSWNVALSLDARKGRIIIEDATFADAASFHTFFTHPAHRAAAEHMATIADWWIGDYHDDDH